MTTTVNLEQSIVRVREWRDKAVAKANDRHAAELIKIQAQFERRLRKIELKGAK